MRPNLSQQEKGGEFLNIRSKEADGPKFSFRWKIDHEAILENNFFPGPGAYESYLDQLVGSGPHHGIGTSKRPGDKKKKKYGTPAPGEYEIDRNIGAKGTTIGNSLRKNMDEVDPEMEVGPGEYDIKSTVP